MSDHKEILKRPAVILERSCLDSPGEEWLTSPCYSHSLTSSSLAFESITDVLLENPNLNSNLLFRADIISDSEGLLLTNRQKEDTYHLRHSEDSPSPEENSDEEVDALSAPTFVGFEIRRTVVRRLIPRKPQVDAALVQTCHIYRGDRSQRTTDPNKPGSDAANGEDDRYLVLYLPHGSHDPEFQLPYYHPDVRAMAYLYEEALMSSEIDDQSRGILSVHFLSLPTSHAPVGEKQPADRLHRTLLSLLSTYVRLISRWGPPEDYEMTDTSLSTATREIKDSIIPEHLVQNRYAQLKQRYAEDLINSWAEKTNPLKHVFEDLSIAAFLIELWTRMYGKETKHFPGFVDMACGNGLLTYVLIMEGYEGRGFDAHKRRSWSKYPSNVKARLKQSICIPNPFLRLLKADDFPFDPAIPIDNGIFPDRTFIISNHTDELTVWTPILARLSGQESPLPWLAIPCCSRALSGASHRYSILRSTSSKTCAQDSSLGGNSPDSTTTGGQSQTGDLKALHAAKFHSSGKPKQASTYKALVDHVTNLAGQVGYLGDVQTVLMRIPSTRNIGIVGGARSTAAETQISKNSNGHAEIALKIEEVIAEECRREGGVLEAAKVWIKSIQRVMAC